MIIHSNFVKGAVTTKKQAELLALGVQFIKDDNGVCWYDAAKELAAKGLAAVAYDQDGTVCSFDKDPTMLFPIGLSVVGVAELPFALDISGNWVFNGTEFIHDRNRLVTVAAETKRSLLVDNELLINMYEKLIIDSPIDTKLLNDLEQLKQYRAALMAVDVSRAPSIDWPVPPIL